MTKISDKRVGRTISILRELSIGKTLTLKNGFTIGMAEDMTVGFVYNGGISRLSEINVRELDEILEREGVNVAF